ncbi:hypothetical protein KP003_16755 [Geomonas nitrogeniifigens]|uniref:hypothetical protein n=1 Tax=Geomonas diazotrophica TaxID=2843197 RepID=UPI001C2C2587|nr:hypothetical protein [Geomonas nitrogeniifigens]QXE85992.1 hypothetical protein KP003_16755 [Geomonas nitrogeniifigens]
MNTPQEFEPLAFWMGWEKNEDGELWLKPEGIAHPVYKPFFSKAECIEALNRLVEKGYGYTLDNQVDEPHKHRLQIYTPVRHWSGWQPTINQAVEQALLRLIEAEKEATADAIRYCNEMAVKHNW